MIGQYLSNTNEIDTIHILQKILELNKAMESARPGSRNSEREWDMLKYLGMTK